MSRDTEDVVGLTERLQTEADLCRNDGADDIAALLDEAASDRQSLSDRIDVLEGRLESLGGGCEANDGGPHSAMKTNGGDFCPDCGLMLKRVAYVLPHVKPGTVRAALHQEGIAP